MNWKIIFLPIAIPVELASAVVTGSECGFGNWVLDRRLGDSEGGFFQTRDEANQEAKDRNK